MPISPAQIARIRQLHKHRTPGRWHVVGDPWGDGTVIIAGHRHPPAPFVCDCEDWNYEDGARDNARPNAAFIVAAANAIIPALDEIERLREREQRLVRLQPEISHYLRGCHEQWLAQRVESLCDEMRAALAPSPAEEGVTTDGK